MVGVNVSQALRCRRQLDDEDQRVEKSSVDPIDVETASVVVVEALH